MDTETLTALSQATAADTDSPDQHSDGETAEEVIARGQIPPGYTRDKETGQIRPKKTRGRPRGGTAAPRPDQPIQRGQDEAPDSKRKGKKQTPTPRYVKGVIAVGMTKLYRRTGRIVKAMDKDIGIAIIESAEDCGEAWDELARTNPRVRKFLLKLVSGGAWGSVIMAHAPILLAVIMKDGIKKHIPFMKLLNSVLEDSDSDDEIASMLGGMSPDDMQQVMAMAQNMMGGMAARAARNGEPS